MTTENRNDCVHRESCRRCQSQAEKQRMSYLLLECWDCDLYVSRYKVTAWWLLGLEMGYKICGIERAVQEESGSNDIPDNPEVTF